MPETQEIEIGKIGANPDQPRRFFDEAALAELGDSIKQNGLLQPVVLRPSGQPSTPYMIVAGERRWRAAKTAGLATITALVMADISDEDAFVLAIAENVNREDMTIVEEAKAYAKLAGLGWAVDRIADKFGKSVTHIQWRLGLLTLHPEVQKMVEKDQIKPNLAWHIAQLNHDNQLLAAGRYLRGDFDTEIEAANFAQGLRMTQEQTSLVASEAPSVAEKEKRAVAKKKTEDKLAALDAIMPLIDELTEVKPEELAVVLGADLGRYVREWDRFTNRVQLVRRVLRQADGIAKAMEAKVNEDAKPAKAEGKGRAPFEVVGEATVPADKPAEQPAEPAKKPAGKATRKAPADAAKKPAAKAAAKSTAKAKANGNLRVVKDGDTATDKGGKETTGKE